MCKLQDLRRLGRRLDRNLARQHRSLPLLQARCRQAEQRRVRCRQIRQGRDRDLDAHSARPRNHPIFIHRRHRGRRRRVNQGRGCHFRRCRPPGRPRMQRGRRPSDLRQHEGRRHRHRLQGRQERLREPVRVHEDRRKACRRSLGLRYWRLLRRRRPRPSRSCHHQHPPRHRCRGSCRPLHALLNFEDHGPPVRRFVCAAHSE
mmetsp:Transcript_17619/g.49857  ORF Transcript_17619/g.49857 Transcript_17619/m.49857 type:complete len:203 (-) Transcript_17619:61-669(-)